MPKCFVFPSYAPLLYHVVSDLHDCYRSSMVQRDRIEVKVAMLSFISAAIPRSSDEEQRLVTRVESEITDNQIAGTK